MNRQDQKLSGSLLTFIVLQLCYLFFFFIGFPEAFREALQDHGIPLNFIASWLSVTTMLGYCVISLISVIQLVMRRHMFMFWFQISGLVALVGNFFVYAMKQIADSMYSDYKYHIDVDQYWILFILALFWTVIWSMYFARSSRVYSYMERNSAYLRVALFTKNVKEPTPWNGGIEGPPYPCAPQQPPQGPIPPRQQQVQQPPVAQQRAPAGYQQPPMGYQQPPQQPSMQRAQPPVRQAPPVGEAPHQPQPDAPANNTNDGLR